LRSSLSAFPLRSIGALRMFLHFLKMNALISVFSYARRAHNAFFSNNCQLHCKGATFLQQKPVSP
jgi:hypothetical protein